jgi:hypothetical protein
MITHLQVDNLLKANPASVEHVLAHSLHLIDEDVLDSPPRYEAGLFSSADRAPLSGWQNVVPHDRHILRCVLVCQPSLYII